jgi:C4-dicarboxylate-specific signal transduction histidine kinase
MDLAETDKSVNLEQMHRLLKRQLLRCFGEDLALSTELTDFVDAVNAAYQSADDEYAMLDRILNLNSEELLEGNHRFQVLLEDVERQVQERTHDLELANANLKQEITERTLAEESLRKSEEHSKQQTLKLKQTLQQLRSTQAQLIQTGKMSGLGQLVAGVAHEINNPISFIYGNINHANSYIDSLVHLLSLYQKYYPDANREIQLEIEAIDLEFLLEDLSKILLSMKAGADRIRQIVLSLRNFSRLDEAEMKQVDIHEGIESTLLLLQNRLNTKNSKAIAVAKNFYENLPSVECYVGQLNQVFMHVLNNAIDAVQLESEPAIAITTKQNYLNKSIQIYIKDNGIGITPTIREKIFDPFFTTKSVGSGKGLGLSISYQIVVEQHGGKLEVSSEPSLGSDFMIEIPLNPFSPVS